MPGGGRGDLRRARRAGVPAWVSLSAHRVDDGGGRAARRRVRDRRRVPGGDRGRCELRRAARGRRPPCRSRASCHVQAARRLPEQRRELGRRAALLDRLRRDRRRRRAVDWLELGVRYVGGCCRVGPAQITTIALCGARYRLIAGPRLSCVGFDVTTLGTNTELLTLPFERPLAEWDDERIVLRAPRHLAARRAVRRRRRRGVRDQGGHRPVRAARARAAARARRALRAGGRRVRHGRRTHRPTTARSSAAC